MWLGALLRVLVASLSLVLAPGIAVADHATRPHTKNMHAKGHGEHPATSPRRTGDQGDIFVWATSWCAA